MRDAEPPPGCTLQLAAHPRGERFDRANGLHAIASYDVELPNGLRQHDSGGACVRTTGTQDVTVFGINKSGDKWTFARQTAAVAFTDWVRTFVPR